ncbi:zinc finger B-box domain-containing protein 1 isoform X1 [Lates japonicus]|uniref:Zinc finger B-box domain-containing protein 1 isoform X1 n=1 Tax=Lates japonicus TaxID=270547 RepID=A0AAD3NGE2_LATJO|nr:zinc finger B-box domain-containing protein 1 isoform X1 [Lates japonicus]
MRLTVRDSHKGTTTVLAPCSQPLVKPRTVSATIVKAPKLMREKGRAEVQQVLYVSCSTFAPLSPFCSYSLSPGSESQGPSSSLSPDTEKHLVFRLMKDNHMQLSGIQIRSTTPTRRGEISANELGTSGSNWFGKSTPTLSHPPRIIPSPSLSLSHSPSPPLSACLSHPTLGSELDPAFFSLSRAAQEIMEICSVDQTGCEDPDLDTDTTAHTLNSLEQELRLLAKETGMQASVFGMANSGGQDQHGNQHLTRDRVSEEQKEEEEAVQRDRQSVLLLP